MYTWMYQVEKISFTYPTIFFRKYKNANEWPTPTQANCRRKHTAQKYMIAINMVQKLYFKIKCFVCFNNGALCWSCVSDKWFLWFHSTTDRLFPYAFDCVDLNIDIILIFETVTTQLFEWNSISYSVVLCLFQMKEIITKSGVPLIL